MESDESFVYTTDEDEWDDFMIPATEGLKILFKNKEIIGNFTKIKS